MFYTLKWGGQVGSYNLFYWSPDKSVSSTLASRLQSYSNLDSLYCILHSLCQVDETILYHSTFSSLLWYFLLSILSYFPSSSQILHSWPAQLGLSLSCIRSSRYILILVVVISLPPQTPINALTKQGDYSALLAWRKEKV